MQTDKIPSEIEIKNTKDISKKQQNKSNPDETQAEKVAEQTQQDTSTSQPSPPTVAVVERGGEATTTQATTDSTTEASSSTASTASSTKSNDPTTSASTEPPKRLKQPRCELAECKKRIGFMGYPCNCGHTFCAAHRHAKDHHCTFDYKAADRRELVKRNGSQSSASFSKVTKI